MDRGVKIAIFVASIGALALGLIWDQVLSHARVMVEQPSDDPLAAELMDARVGSPEIGRMEPQAGLDPQFQTQPVDDPPVDAQPETPVVQAWQDYEIQSGDSYWKLAYVTFKDRGLTSDDLKKANDDKVLKPGETLRIPPGKAALEQGPPPSQPTPTQAGTAGATEYTIQEGDSWWKIANTRFKDRGLTSKQLEDANPGVKMSAGNKIVIPAK